MLEVLKMRRAISLVLIVLMIISYGAVSAKPLLDGSVEFLAKTENLANTTKDISLALMALIAAQGKVDYDLSENITRLADLLISRQNPDGGWGYFAGSTSNVVDTSYALVALAKSLTFYEEYPEKYKQLKKSIASGIGYLYTSFDGRGWGYIKGDTPRFYPTMMALWALGENGHTLNDFYVRTAIYYLERGEISMDIDENKALALELLSYKSIGYKVDDIPQKIEAILNTNQLTPEEYAFLLYAFLSYDSSVDIKKAYMVSKLEHLGHIYENISYWENRGDNLIPTQITPSTSYAAMSLALVSDYLPYTFSNEFSAFCDALKNSQNMDGGWGYLPESPSSPRITYYSLKALRACSNNNEAIEKGLDWVRGELSKLNYESDFIGFLYLLMTLSEFNALSQEESGKYIDIIRKMEIEPGKWGNILGPQPYYTALAVRTLLSLGVPENDPDIVKAREWLLSLSSDGWGTYISHEFISYMLAPDVPTTLEVLEALKPLISKEDIISHLEWLINQKTDEGWPTMKVTYVAGIPMYMGNPNPSLTFRAVLLLKEYRYNFEDYGTLWIRKIYHERDYQHSLNYAMALIYLAKSQAIYETNIYSTLRNFYYSNITVEYYGGYNKAAYEITPLLESRFYTKHIEVSNFTGDVEAPGNYVVLMPFENPAVYNPSIPIKLSGDELCIVGGRCFNTANTVLVFPAKTTQSNILFIMLPESEYVTETLKILLDSGLIKYSRGIALIASFNDTNNNGYIDDSEISLYFVR